MKKNHHSLKWIAFCLLALGVQWANAQNAQDRRSIKKATNVTRLETLRQQLSETNRIEKQKAERLAKEKGWMIRGEVNGSYIELMKVIDGRPVYYQTYNVDAAKSTRANTLNSGGILGLDLNGEDMEVYVWDGGHALVSHNEYDGAGGNNRVTVKDTPSETNYHSGHVMGTILASGYDPKAKGMAPKAKGYSYEWTNDDAEASAAAGQGMILSNHSYGFKSDIVPDSYFGSYIGESQIWDQIMYEAPYYLMVCAAGNDGDHDSYNESPLDGYSAYDKLTGHSVSKNNLVVGNVNDVPVNANGEVNGSIIRATSSSEGPTDDYRIKPDIMGNGTQLYSSGVDANNDYLSITGTSMASPNVTGTLVLLQQHYKNLNGGFMKAATLKGLVLHTADDFDANGPDANSGWGLLNAKKAAQVISAKSSGGSVIKEIKLNQGNSYSITVNATGSEDLMASISWTDPAGKAVDGLNSKTPVLVNDLDIKVTKNSSSYLPWKLTGVTSNGKGDNIVDPYERVDVANASGSYTVTVTHKGELRSGVQNFSLIITGASGDNGDNQAPTAPSNLTASNATSNSVELTWGASSDNIGVAAYEIYQDGKLIKNVSSNGALITGLTPNTTYSFKVRAYDADGNFSGYSNTINVTTKSGGSPQYCDSKGENSNSEYISQVKFGDISKSSSSSSYSDFTSENTDMKAGSSATLEVHKGWRSSPFTDGVAAWIDFNQDGDFDDAGENVMSSAASKVTPVSSTVNIPANAKPGLTRMRVSLRYFKVPTSCETIPYGEVEDYSINIVTDGGGGGNDDTPPTTPSNLTASNITENSVNLSWDGSSDNVGVTSYEVYQNNSFAKSVTSTEANITGLSAKTSYTFYVVAKDKAGNSSRKSNVVEVTTKDNTVEYCDLSGDNARLEWIDLVSLNGMENRTASDNGYGDYTSKTASLPYGANTISFSAGFKSSAYTEHWYVWIDYDQNGQFSSTELVAKTSSNSSNTLNESFQVPTSAKTGSTRMRVAAKYTRSDDSCGSFSYGEVEDYTVTIGNSAYDLSKAEDALTPVTETVSVYPNPVASGSVIVKSTEITEGQYELIDMNGKLQRYGTFDNKSMKINVDGLNSGKYIIRIAKDGRKATASLIIK